MSEKIKLNELARQMAKAKFLSAAMHEKQYTDTRERERERQTDRQTYIQRQTDTYTKGLSKEAGF